ncbi:glutathione S-transferase [Thalassobaculum sp.]|uniref:glutathione S-transferase family protein n=1 Tax=Thalassobaculum sp. TaxID=2022740 RepID=UPI0032EC835E
MKVYEFKGFPNPARIRIALAEKRLFDAVEFVHVDVPGGEHRQPAFLAKNPSGAVPVLELDDGTLISECSAITEYLDHADGDPVLTGRDARERAVIHMTQRKIEAGLLDAVAAFFHHATDGLGPAIETYQNRDWGLRQRDVAVATMRRMDGMLAARPYLAADRFTVADITAMAGFAFADFVSLAIPDDCARLSAWRARVSARPSAAVAA